ncbi:MAG: tRNA (adenosine(37)-N6)-threonylcarbamoyltransferase complex ATPase subunit type 1 TsaE, partial [Armatimonadetes bacterium]|nr:tRNA (adenosine(37)-N6)-threonylcarbamoyltransferase complex ATPase subunit type 1 TsaE [Armatimonadota bacterium]
GAGSSEAVTSPTFVLLHIYEGGRLPVYHFDAYRLQGPGELLEIGCEEPRGHRDR